MEWVVPDGTSMALRSSWFTPIDFRFHFPAPHKLCRSAHYTIAEVTCAAHQPIEKFDSLQRQTCTLPSQKEQKKTPTMQKHNEETYYFGRDRNQGRLLVEDLSYILTVPDGYHSHNGLRVTLVSSHYKKQVPAQVEAVSWHGSSPIMNVNAFLWVVEHTGERWSLWDWAQWGINLHLASRPWRCKLTIGHVSAAFYRANIFNSASDRKPHFSILRHVTDQDFAAEFQGKRMPRKEMKIATHQEGQLTVCRHSLLDQVFSIIHFLYTCWPRSVDRRASNRITAAYLVL